MPRLWTENKNYTDSLNANTRYLVGAANGGCNYQTIPEGSTKRVLHGAANGACYYGNETVPFKGFNFNSYVPKGLCSANLRQRATCYYSVSVVNANTLSGTYSSKSTPDSEYIGLMFPKTYSVSNLLNMFNAVTTIIVKTTSSSQPIETYTFAGTATYVEDYYGDWIIKRTINASPVFGARATQFQFI